MLVYDRLGNKEDSNEEIIDQQEKGLVKEPIRKQLQEVGSAGFGVAVAVGSTAIILVGR